jgi:hypothetical protein
MTIIRWGERGVMCLFWLATAQGIIKIGDPVGCSYQQTNAMESKSEAGRGEEREIRGSGRRRSKRRSSLLLRGESKNGGKEDASACRRGVDSKSC